MFCSLVHQKCFPFNKATRQFVCRYQIIDSGFEEVIDDQFDGLGAVIEVYERRKLNVAANLVKAILYLNDNFHRPIKSTIDECKNYLPKFVLYEKDIEKYLVLL
jgi:hypothetical protein